MKPLVLHPLSVLLGAGVLGVLLFGTSAQTVDRVPPRDYTLIRGYPYPIEKLELVPVAVKPDDPAAQLVTVPVGERLLLLGPWNGYSNPYVQAFPVPLQASGANYKFVPQAPVLTKAPLESGVPACWLDHGIYILAESAGSGGTATAPRAFLIGYRIKI